MRLRRGGFAATLTQPMEDELDREAIGQRIKLARIAAGFRTQKAFADAVGVYLPNANKWEKGKALPDTVQLAKICSVTGVSAEEIWYGRRTSSPGGGAVRIEALKKLFASDEGKRLTSKQRYALGELLEGLEVDEWRVRAALELMAIVPSSQPPKAPSTKKP